MVVCLGRKRNNGVHPADRAEDKEDFASNVPIDAVHEREQLNLLTNYKFKIFQKIKSM